ncbi:MAG: phage tail protein [Enterobacterales bacterium endosymbiont of Blomia tropicalis]|uniref:gp53-like domain-containing protein n=1 Tax=Mixta mediterraneensis TaxID=2758443 RepID=UPI0025A6D3B9|nr:phage tail protein [Mixta mediterraneensis]MDL4913727.1 phage tail protein [Mixta mediterraneensis]
MANLPETPQWEEGIYQIEVSDPVLGGPDGISNRQGKQLASRTLYLKQQVEKGGSDLAKHIAAADPHTQYAPKASPTFTGTPTAPTPAANDNSKKLVTTEFVARAIAALAGTAPETLDTLKELADALGNDPNFATTVLNKLAEKLAKDQNGADIPDPALFVKNLGLGKAATRDVGTGKNQVPDMSAFTGNFGNTGWRKLPDGTIEQWGTSVTGADGSVNIRFPVPFSEKCYTILGLISSQGVTPANNVSYFPPSLSEFTMFSSSPSGTAVTGTGFSWRAFGK